MLEKLLNQYKKINGIENLDINDLKNEMFREEFILWLKIRQQYGYRYLDFLYEINESILDRTTAEVGKTGSLPSSMSFLGSPTAICSSNKAEKSLRQVPT